MKRTFRTLALVLAMLMLMQSFSVAAFDSKSMTENEWKELYASLRDENTLPTLCVGANETQLNICWHADKDTAKAKVRLADNKAMQNAVVFDIIFLIYFLGGKFYDSFYHTGYSIFPVSCTNGFCRF